MGTLRTQNQYDRTVMALGTPTAVTNVEASILAAGGAGVYLDLVELVVAHNQATPHLVKIRDGSGVDAITSP